MIIFILYNVLKNAKIINEEQFSGWKRSGVGKLLDYKGATQEIFASEGTILYPNCGSGYMRPR